MISNFDAALIIIGFFWIFLIQFFHAKQRDAENLRLLRRVCELENVLFSQFQIVVQPKDKP